MGLLHPWVLTCDEFGCEVAESSVRSSLRLNPERYERVSRGCYRLGKP